MVRNRWIARSMVGTALLALSACGPTTGTGSGIVLGPGSGPHALAMSGDSLDKLARNPLIWSVGDTAMRRCRAGSSCSAAGGRVRVVLSADTGARRRNPSVRSGNILIGKLQNLGAAQDIMYGLKPGPFNYLVFIVPGGTADTGRFIVEQVNKNPPYAHQTVASGPFIGCKHNKTWTKSFGRFLSCADGPPTERVTSRAQPRGIRNAGIANIFGWLALFRMEAENPSWFTCTSGCCTAGSVLTLVE